MVQVAQHARGHSSTGAFDAGNEAPTVEKGVPCIAELLPLY